MIADLVVTVAIYRSEGGYLAVCPEFGVEASGWSPGDAKEEAVGALRRYLDDRTARGELESCLAEAGFVVEDGAFRAERRLVGVEEGRIPISF